MHAESETYGGTERARDREKRTLKKFATAERAKDKRWAFFYLLIYVKGTV